MLRHVGVSDRILQGATGIDSTLDQAIDYYMDEDEPEDDNFKELDF